jgi:hypothetical protein
MRAAGLLALAVLAAAAALAAAADPALAATGGVARSIAPEAGLTNLISAGSSSDGDGPGASAATKRSSKRAGAGGAATAAAVRPAAAGAAGGADKSQQQKRQQQDHAMAAKPTRRDTPRQQQQEEGKHEGGATGAPEQQRSSRRSATEGEAEARGAAGPGAGKEPPRRPVALPPREAAAAAAAAALSRKAPLEAHALPAPRYVNYSLAASRDTFEICKNQSGLGREISMEELLPIYGLPQELLQHRRVSLATLTAAIAAAAPTARLVIAPLLAGEAELSPVLHPDARLPRLLHFTVRDKDAMLPHQALSIATWARLNPGYSILLYDDDDISAFMHAYHAHLLPLFHRLGSQVERTDLWRYLVLCTFGGVYADSDVVAGRPVDTWAQDAGLLTGVENVFESMAAARRRDYTRVMQIVQWTIAARPGHPVVCRMGDYISRRVQAEAAGAVSEGDRDHAILERTGPGIWSSSVHDYLRAHGVVPESAVGGAKVGDVRLLPQSVFGCASSTVNLSDPMAYVYHQFKGSWRLHEPGKLLQFISHLYSHLFASPAAQGGGAPASPAVERPAAAAGSNGKASGGARGTAQGEARAEAAAGKRRAPAARKQLRRRQQPAAAAAAKRPAAGAAAAAAPAPAPAAKAGAAKAAAMALGSASASVGGRGAAGAVLERRLQEQAPPATAALMQLQPLARPEPQRREARMPLLPLASGLVVAALICSAAAQRGGRCGSNGAGGRPCGGLRQSASGALHGIWGSAKRLAGGGRGGGLPASASGAALLPLSQQQGGARPPSGGSGGAGGCAAVVAAASATRQQGCASGGCLKRSSGSVQCLSNMQ